MKVIRGMEMSISNEQACVATIGNFDGLHLGHQKIIQLLNEKAKELQLPLAVISFEPLPAEFFSKKPPARIYPFRDKVRMLANLGVDIFLCLKFNSTLANMPPGLFVEKVLSDCLKVKYLAVGDDFRFGHNRTGDFALLQQLGKQTGMLVNQTQTVEQQGERVSSTRIRIALEQGDINTANDLLGHGYQLSGRVRHGDKRGRTIGFPTLNMKVPEHIAPHRGVYAVRVHGLADVTLDGVANLGVRPSVNGSENRLETHLFDFEGEVYGKTICVELIRFIRAEKRFDNFDDLKEQILLDVKQAKDLLSL
jgi:riboflavin kinase/FMN adenylyltransferase